MKFTLVSLFAVALLSPGVGFAQIEVQLRVGQQPGWNPMAREGGCQVRIWVDHLAELRMRGDRITVRTLEGNRSYDEGSSCSSPIPYNAVRDFQIRQLSGRGRVSVRQEPNRGNNFTAVVAINDDQGGGDHYAFEVTWRGEGGLTNSPAPYFDDIRACQDSVRQRFLSKNGRGAYIDFDGPANRQNRNKNQELIEGRGDARTSMDSRELTYSCVVETRTGRVRSADYQYAGRGSRRNNRDELR